MSQAPESGTPPKSSHGQKRILWRKSERSGLANCVEVAFIGGMIGIRDSKDTAQSVQLYTRDEWRAFVGGIKAGEFDDLVDG